MQWTVFFRNYLSSRHFLSLLVLIIKERSSDLVASRTLEAFNPFRRMSLSTLRLSTQSVRKSTFAVHNCGIVHCH